MRGASHFTSGTHTHRVNDTAGKIWPEVELRSQFIEPDFEVTRQQSTSVLQVLGPH